MTALPCTEAAEWDEFLSSVPSATPQHAFAWGESLASSFGFVDLAYSLFTADGRTVAALPVVRFSALGPFRAVYSQVFDSYGGPLVHPDHVDDTDLLARISAEMDAQAAAYKAFEARILVSPTAPRAVHDCMKAGKRVESFERKCPILDLDRPMEEVSKGYSSSVRRAIRRAAKENVVVEEDVAPEVVREAYAIYAGTMERIGGTTKPWHFLETLLRSKLARAFVARHDGRPIGMVILLVSPCSKMAMYWISSSDAAASAMRPTNALVDAAVRWCHRRGLAAFSFGESPGERPGLVKFKEGWSPESLHSTTVVRTYRPLVSRTWKTLQPMARWAYALFDRLKGGKGKGA